MKKMMAALLAVMMLAMGMTALADEAPQPEGGKKFESSWALMGGLAEIFYEEEGYRVSVDLRNGDHGTLWQYSCHYVEEKDALLSVSSTKWDYTLDGDGAEVPGEIAYQGLDDESTAFTIDEKGFLHWDEARENAGADLEFRTPGVSCFGSPSVLVRELSVAGT